MHVIQKMELDIHIINPNSLHEVTATIARAVSDPIPGGGVRFTFATLDDAPPGIASQRDADRAAPLVADYVCAHPEAAGFVIACYSDPGLFAAMESTSAPVIGIGKAGLDAALIRAKRVGVIAVNAAGIDRHWRYYRMLGVAQSVVGERSADLSVRESADRDIALHRLVDVASALRHEDGADVIVLGCAGMSEMRLDVEQAIGIPVIDPCTAAVEVILRELDGHRHSTR